MGQRFEVTWADEVGATPGAVWDAITRHCDGWLWPIGYEPRLGGAEVGLTPDGGTVTDWVPERHFSTTGPMEGGTNRVEYRLTPSADGTRTAVEFRHDGIVGDDEDLALQYDACVVHTELYRHSMAEYATHFAGRDATYVEVDAGEASQAEGSTVRLTEALGLDTAAVGDEVTLAVPGAAPLRCVVDYREQTFVGLRSAHGLHRIYGRDRWGWPVSVAHHLFDPAADGAVVEAAWRAFLDSTYEPTEQLRETV